MFRGWFAMNRRCDHCGLYFEREPGYFLGAIYFNYGVTVGLVTAAYLIPMFVLGRSINELLIPLVAFCVVFPLIFYRHARSFFLAFDHYFSKLDPTYRPPFETKPGPGPGE
jgi:hypothetical protein